MLERRSSPPHSRARVVARRLAERRRRRRRYLFATGGLLGVAVVGLALWGLWQSAVRISRVSVSNNDPAIVALVQQAMRGTYFHLIPRSSAFFYPSAVIREDVLAHDPGFAAVSIRRVGGTGLHLTVTDRVALARWCGADATSTFQQCYVFDPNGFVFATTSPRILQTPSNASTTATSTVALQPVAVAVTSLPITRFNTVDPYVVYEPLTTTTEQPIGATLPNEASLPAIFSFAQQLMPFGSAVQSIYIHDGEVDNTLASGTVVKYLLGQGSQALSELTSASPDLNLTDGSLQYVDLRFSGKVYVKKRGSVGPGS